MAYSAEKDKVIAELGQVGETSMFGEIRSYDGGEEKLSVYRVVGKEGEKRRQVFRIPLTEVEELSDFLSVVSVDLVDDEEVYEEEEDEEEEIDF